MVVANKPRSSELNQEDQERQAQPDATGFIGY